MCAHIKHICLCVCVFYLGVGEHLGQMPLDEDQLGDWKGEKTISKPQFIGPGAQLYQGPALS